MSLILVTDRGTCFTSIQFATFCQQHGIHHTLNSSRWPQANGQVERVNRTLISVMASSVQEEEHWDNALPQVERSINTFYKKTIRKSPFEALYGYLPSFGHDKLANRVLNVEFNPPEEIQKEIRQEILKAQEKYKETYDKRRFIGVTYDVGEVVFMRGAKTATGEPSKLQPRYKGPYVIVQTLPSDTYRVHSLDSNRRFETTAHVSQLKSYKGATEDDSEEEEENEVSEEEEARDVPEEIPVEAAGVVSDAKVQSDGENKVTSEGKRVRVKRLIKPPNRFKDYV